ncbi:MAG: DUF2284 domain-containing protein [Blautia sp.]
MNGVKHMQTNYDDITRAAIKLGFSAAAVMDTGNLVFKTGIPGYSDEENQCGNYNLNPACPPESGTVEEMVARALKYMKNPGSSDHPDNGDGLQKSQTFS